MKVFSHHHLIFAFLLVLIATAQGYTKDLYSSQEYWGFYVDSCASIDSAMATVRDQISKDSDSLFSNSVKFHIKRMEESIKKVKAVDIENKTHQMCQNKLLDANKLLQLADKYDERIEKKLDIEARRDHESSPIYKKASEFGFKDYGWLGSIYSEYNKNGEDELRQWMFLVDNECGSSYRAVKYDYPYVFFIATPSRNNLCGRKEIIAILPANGFMVKKGEYISNKSYYTFQGLLEGATIDGFPAKILLLKQVQAKK